LPGEHLDGRFDDLFPPPLAVRVEGAVNRS
jgi:hypothetical protein